MSTTPDSMLTRQCTARTIIALEALRSMEAPYFFYRRHCGQGRSYRGRGCRTRSPSKYHVQGRIKKRWTPDPGPLVGQDAQALHPYCSRRYRKGRVVTVRPFPRPHHLSRTLIPRSFQNHPRCAFSAVCGIGMPCPARGRSPFKPGSYKLPENRF